ncbi:PSP1 domain-containing protein [Alteribacillus iranensis]|uniref:Cell fate regulator YaaT, PSP1 superfamily (Controls sporulation, competence, biofilm development) n=1 Tax=Alteribacillus iranensis TaxID=930128 RepID=A0A1I2FFB1_9BACI|nr:stage 0 sporulation family protein [Alteribacillus iranensis]SFF03161.1 Cell fate regulator YaaT, PSP1 superfamily (controls sporulation, competence, biofilm development) [Alteribacillus iranensis]
MYEVIGVRFKKAGKIYYFSPGDLQIENGQWVVVETARGIEFGKVVLDKKQVSGDDVVLPLKKVVRVANDNDKLIIKENKDLAQRAYDVCNEKIAEHQLDMKLVDVEYTFDRNKVLFYFTADGRIDFRELVKDLASVFRTRIELRQIGVRDEAKMLGGIGPCGRVLCCSSFLGDFEPVSIKMAKDQNLSLNPAKISGLCGRLMCCLKYENDHYEEAKKELPDVGETITTPQGKGKVVGINILERLVQVNVSEPQNVLEYSLEELMEEGYIVG